MERTLIPILGGTSIVICPLCKSQFEVTNSEVKENDFGTHTCPGCKTPIVMRRIQMLAVCEPCSNCLTPIIGERYTHTAQVSGPLCYECHKEALADPVHGLLARRITVCAGRYGASVTAPSATTASTSIIPRGRRK